MLFVRVDWVAAAAGTFAPQLKGPGALSVAVGILGATVMPHAIYLRSGLTQDRTLARNHTERFKLVRFSNVEVLIALTVAGLVTMAMAVMASGAFHAGPSRSRGNRNGISQPHAVARLGGGRHFFRFAARIGRVQLGGHDGRTDDHAGLHRLSHPGGSSPSGNHGARVHRGRARRKRDFSPRRQPGLTEFRLARADDRAGDPELAA